MRPSTINVQLAWTVIGIALLLGAGLYFFATEQFTDLSNWLLGAGAGWGAGRALHVLIDTVDLRREARERTGRKETDRS